MRVKLKEFNIRRDGGISVEYDFESDAASSKLLNNLIKLGGELAYIQTYSGKKFFPLDPDESGVDIIDIAHALSMKCRFGGHCNHFYSVAQHSVIVSYNCNDPLQGLMHDSGEAYLPDVASPIKKYIQGFNKIEEDVVKVIFNKYNIPYPLDPSVKVADLRILATEYRDLMSKSAECKWELLDGVESYPKIITPLNPSDAKQLFLNRFYELTK